MTIRSIEPSSAGAVAKLMSTIKPDWWDFEGASGQLQDVGLLAKLVGWYLEEDGAPRGWLLCAEFEGYSCLSIENLGYDENGVFVMEEPLAPLLRRAEQYARQKGLRSMRYVIGSTGMSCHGRPITDFAGELRTLHSFGRAHFDFFRSCAHRFSPQLLRGELPWHHHDQIAAVSLRWQAVQPEKQASPLGAGVFPAPSFCVSPPALGTFCRPPAARPGRSFAPAPFRRRRVWPPPRKRRNFLVYINSIAVVYWPKHKAFWPKFGHFTHGFFLDFVVSCRYSAAPGSKSKRRVRYVF